jgi:hypothetical protein
MFRIKRNIDNFSIITLKEEKYNLGLTKISLPENKFACGFALLKWKVVCAGSYADQEE